MKERIDRLLVLGNEAICYTKYVLKFGLGNIIEDILESESQSLGRCDYARTMYNEAYDLSFNKLKAILLRASAAIIAQGGNCHEAASLVFVKLMIITSNETIELCRKKMEENPEDYHVYVRIRLDDGQFIIVDEWGSNSKSKLVTEDDGEAIVIHQELSHDISESLCATIDLIKQTKKYILNKNILDDLSGKSDNQFVTKDDLTYLWTDKFIGARMHRAYHDPGRS